MASKLSGYVMSWSQLDELWRYDNELANLFLGIPLRTCSAKPKESAHSISEKELCYLKSKIRRMWVRASLDIEGYEVLDECENELGYLKKVGWGLRVRNGDAVSFPASQQTLFGWLAFAPMGDECPTAHRYLRSPAEGNIYIGGPISYCNKGGPNTIRAKFLDQAKDSTKFSVSIYTTGRLQPSTILLWDYNLKGNIRLHDIEEWQLDTCCSESCEGNTQHDPPKTKIRKISSSKRSHTFLTSSELCLYCGKDLFSGTSVQKVSMKSHLASNHSVQICIDKDLQYAVDKKEEALTLSDFLIALHTLHEVSVMLRKHNFIVVPACNFFIHSGLKILEENSSEEEKQHIFEDFVKTARAAFANYRVLYLRGSVVPKRYDHLLPLTSKHAFKHLSWRNGNRPPSSSLSVAPHIKTEDEAALASEVLTDVKQVILDYSELVSITL